MATAGSYEFPVPIGIRAGHATIAPARQLDGAAVRAAIDRTNRASAVPGLAPEFDAEAIDADKVLALLDALSRLPAAALSAVEGRQIALNHQGLLVGAAQPTRPSSFGSITRIDRQAGAAGWVGVGTDAAVDCDLARDKAAAARDAVAGFDAEVRRLEGAGAGPVARSQAKTRRFRAAQVWRLNARHAAACLPAQADAADDLAAAEAAVKAFAVAPQSGGMPAN